MPITTSGFEGLSYDLENLLEGVSPASIKRALGNGAAPVLKKIQENAPVGPTGNLKEALESSAIKQVGGRYFIKIGVINGKRAPHAHLVENGHGGPHPAPPHPFMRPAFDAEKDTAYDAVRDTLREEMRG